MDAVAYYVCFTGIFYFVITANLALHRPTAQSSTYEVYSSSRAVDGNRNTNLASGSCSLTHYNSYAWWRVDLGAVYTIGTVRITNRDTSCSLLNNFDVKVGSSSVSGSHL